MVILKGSWLFPRTVLLAVLMAAAGVSAQADEQTKTYDIAAQDLAPALRTFAKQSDREILFSSEIVAKKQSGEVRGRFVAGAALRATLADTGLAYRLTGAHAFVIVSKSGDAVGHFEIAAGPLARSLLEFTDQSGLDVPAPSALTAGKKSPTVRGDMSSADALGRLLRGSGIGFARGEDGEVTIQINDSHRKTTDTYDSAQQNILVYGHRVQSHPFDPVENIDIPRTIDDPQPYYVFSHEAIDQSGVTDVEEFLKQNLTMNTEALTNGQTGQAFGPNVFGNTSSINLRGLGADHTLILINGRRAAGIATENGTLQPDLNGIPLSAIDRIEVLPSSASGIYGGSAIGGVINVILKRDYSGGEVRAKYDNVTDGNSPARTISLSYGTSLEGGTTHFLVNAQWSDAQPLLLEDRRNLLDRGIDTILKNYPAYLYSTTNPFLGSLPNVANTAGTYNADFSVFTPSPLVLKNGQSLTSGITYIPAGTSSSTSAASLDAGLLANAGAWNLTLPSTAQGPTGLLQPFGATPTTRAFTASIRREMWPNVEAFADFSYNETRTHEAFSPFTYFDAYVPASAPTNPFTTDILVAYPDATQLPTITTSRNESLTVGALAKLPHDWTGEFDFTRAQNRFSYDDRAMCAICTLSQDFTTGKLNPLVDTVQHPLSVGPYLRDVSSSYSSTLNDVAIRGSGPLGTLPWGTPTLTVGLEHLTEVTPDNHSQSIESSSNAGDEYVTAFRNEQDTDSAYVEVITPLVQKERFPLLKLLELQIAGRAERYTVDTGTNLFVSYPNYSPPINSFVGPTLNGGRLVETASYRTKNYTVGLKYQPVSDFILRASVASAFLPPLPGDLTRYPLSDPHNYQTQIIDPKNGRQEVVEVLVGGNPGLKPQSSKSRNIGLVWEPSSATLNGLRFDAEYYDIRQFDAIGSLSPQQIANLEGTFPGRVTRSPTTGLITLVDTSEMNLFERETQGVDVSVDYGKNTSIGVFTVRIVGTEIFALKNQYASTLPVYDAAGFHPTDGGAAKYKSNAILRWQRQRWAAGWTTRYFGSYKQYGAAGSPSSIQNYNGQAFGQTILAQGSDRIPSQTYHDAFASYDLGSPTKEGGGMWSSVFEGMSLEIGVRNIFNTLPPVDVAYLANYYVSPYGDARLRTYWLSARKRF